MKQCKECKYLMMLKIFHVVIYSMLMAILISGDYALPGCQMGSSEASMCSESSCCRSGLLSACSQHPQIYVFHLHHE